jgi:multidrug efflux pump subunit AcrA (membrane-fusion protein)
VDSQNGTVDFAETTGAALGAAKADIDHLEKQMSVLGLSLLAGNKPTAQTATESLLDTVKEESDLATAARSLQDALELALQYTAAYEGIEAGSVSLGSTISDLTLTPEEMRVWIEGANKVFSLDTIYSVFQAAGKLPEDFDAEQEKLAIEADTAAVGGQLIDAFNRGQAG